MGGTWEIHASRVPIARAAMTQAMVAVQKQLHLPTSFQGAWSDEAMEWTACESISQSWSEASPNQKKSHWRRSIAWPSQANRMRSRLLRDINLSHHPRHLNLSHHAKRDILIFFLVVGSSGTSKAPKVSTKSCSTSAKSKASNSSDKASETPKTSKISKTSKASSASTSPAADFFKLPYRSG